MLEHLLHGDGRFDGLEINELIFRHRFCVFNCEELNGSSGI
jgi:hypothetical protein